MALHGILSSNYIKRALSVRPESLVSIWPQAEPSGAISREIVRQYLGAYTGVTLGQPGIGAGRVGLTCPFYDGLNDFNNIYSAGFANDNLLLNPGFETPGGGGADIWANWVEVVADGALANEVVIVHQGADSAKITSGATENTYIYQNVAVVPGEHRRERFWTQGDGVNAGRYRVRDVTNAVDIIPQTTTGITAAAWDMFAVEFTIPPGCVSIAIYLYGPPANGGICYFDACEVRRTNGFLGDRGTIIAPARVFNAGVWTDGLGHHVFNFRVDGSNNCRIYADVPNNTVVYEYMAGAVLESFTEGGHTEIDWMVFGVTWDKPAEEVRFYRAGSQVNLAINLGTWEGNLLFNGIAIGSFWGNAAAAPWYGYIGPVPIWSEALTPDEIAYVSEPQ